jgi:hypothetical protein
MAFNASTGIQNALGMFMDMKSMDMKRRQLNIMEAEEKRTASTWEADQEMQLLQSQGLVDIGKNPYNIDYDVVVKGIQGKDTDLDKKLSQYMQQGDNPLVDKDTEILDIEPIQILDEQGMPTGEFKKSKNGKPMLGVRVRNADGSEGVLTEGGTQSPDDKVIEFTAEKIAGLMDTNYRRNVLSKQSKYSLTIDQAGKALGRSIKELDDFELAQLRDSGKIPPGYDHSKAKTLKKEGEVTDISDALAERGERGGARATINLISTENPDDREKAVDSAVDLLKGEEQLGEDQSEEKEDTITGDTDKKAGADVSEELQTKEARLAELTSKKGRLFSTKDAQEARKLRQEIATLKQQAKGERPKDKTKEETEVSTDAEVDSKVAELKEKIANSKSGGRTKRALELRLERLESQRPSEIIKTAPPVVQENTTAIEAAVSEAKSAEDLSTKIAKQEVKVAPETMSHVANFLKEKGVTSVEEFKKLNKRDFIAAHVAVAASMENDAARSEWLGRITNIGETGLSNMTAQEAGTLELRRKEYDLSYGTWIRNAVKASNKIVGDAAKVVAKAWGEDGLAFDKKAAIAISRSPEFTDLANKLENGSLSRNDLAEGRKAMNMMLSTIMAGMASDEEWVGRLFRKDADDVVIAGDYDLDRVALNGDGTQLLYMTSADEEGKAEQTDVGVDVDKMRDTLPKEAFAMLMMQAAENRKRITG